MNKALFIFISIALLVSTLSGVARDKVIVEIATGTWCQYCPGAAMGADDLVENGHQVAIIENHNSDSFANSGSNARNSYYSVSGYPTAVFDGGNATVGGNHTVSLYGNYLPKVNARLAVNSHFTIVAAGIASDGTYNVTVNLEKVETDTNSNLVLHAVVTESEIQYNWQGQTHLNFVNRLMVPNQSGTSVNFGAGTFLSIPLSFTMNTGWELENCEFVLFLQNNSTREILQGTKYTFTQLFGDNPASVASINYQDTYVTLTESAPLTLTNPGSTTMSGTITSDNPAFYITPALRIDYSIAPYDSQTFDVSFAPTGNATETGNITVTTNLSLYPLIIIPVTGTGVFAPPKAPENVSIEMNGNSAVISWDAVTETIINSPIEPTLYIIYSKSSNDASSLFEIIAVSPTSSYTHVDVGSANDIKLYRITAFYPSVRNGLDPTDILKPGMTEEEVNLILNK